MRKRSVEWSVLLAAVLALAAMAEAGEAKRVASLPSLAIRGYHFMTVVFAQAPPGSGTVHPQAVIAKFADSPITFTVAVDTTDPSAKVPALIRLSFTGEADYSKVPSLPFREVIEDANGVACKIGPDVVRVKVDGRDLPVSIRGSYYRPTGGMRLLTLDLCTALEAKVTFGQANYVVQIVDGDGNLRPGDKVQPIIGGGRVTGRTGGDTVVIDQGDGSFSDKLLVGFYGQPMFVDGSWYDVSLSEDRSRITASKMDVPSGKIRIANDGWEGVFVSEKYVMAYFDGMADRPVDMPVGRYFVKRYRQRFGPGEPPLGKVMNETASRTGGPFLLNGREPSFVVPLGKAADVAIGTPLKITLTAAKREDGSYAFSAKFTDAAGAGNVSVVNAEGDTPTVSARVLGIAGNEVAKVRMRYDRRGSYYCTWQAPQGTRGQFTVVPELEVPPLKIEPVGAAIDIDGSPSGSASSAGATTTVWR